MSLPSHWRTAPACELCAKIQDGTHFSPKGQLREGRYPYVTAKNVRPWGLDLGNLTFLDESAHRSIYDRCDVREGDVLLVKDGANAGDTALNTVKGEISLLSSVCFLRTGDRLSAPFLRYYLQSPIGRRHLLGSLSGSAIRRIVLERVRTLPIVLAPLGEQSRIVAAIESQISRLDAAVASLKRAKANVKRGRASVLKAAVEGRLVPTEAALARAEGRDYEPASVLLDRILAERKAAWETSGARRKYKEPPDPEIELGDNLPEGWRWASFEQTLDPLSDQGKKLPKRLYHSEGAFPVVDQGEDFFGGYTSDDSLVYAGPLPVIVFGDHTRRFKLLNSRFVVGADGVKLIGISGAWYSKFALIALQTMKFEDRGYSRHFQFVRAGNLRLPPLAEQHRILAEVDRRLSVLDALDAALDASLARCARLRQAVLKRAFEGRLVAPAANGRALEERHG